MARKIESIGRASKARLASRKAVLEATQKQLRGAFEQQTALLIESASDPAGCMKARERDVPLQQLEHETRLLHDITVALKKLPGNDYGRCEKCGRAISGKRLDAVPWARFCLACQSKSEDLARVRTSRLRQIA